MTTNRTDWATFHPGTLPLLSLRDGRVVVVAASDAAIREGWAPGIALGLARAWTASGSRVVVVDAGLSRPSLHLHVGMSNEAGLSEALGAGAAIPALTRPVPGEDFFLVTAGEASDDPGESLASGRWPRLCKAFLDAGVTLVVYAPAERPWSAPILGQATDLIRVASPDEALANDPEPPSVLRATLGPPASLRRARAPHGGVVPTVTPAPPEATPVPTDPLHGRPGVRDALDLFDDPASFEDPLERIARDAETAEPEGDPPPPPPPPIHGGGNPPGILGLDLDRSKRRGRRGGPTRPWIGAIRSLQVGRTLGVGVGIAALVAGLSLWGLWGGGTGPQAIPEEAQATPPPESSEDPRLEVPGPTPRETPSGAEADPAAPTPPRTGDGPADAPEDDSVDLPTVSSPAPPDDGSAGTPPRGSGTEIPATSTAARFSIALASYRDAEVALARAESVAERIATAWVAVTPVEVGGTLYHRVLIGLHPDSLSAERARGQLAGVVRGDPGDWIVRRAELAFSFGEWPTLQGAIVEAGALSERGVPAYVLAMDGADGGSPRYRTYAGAYATPTEAEPLADLLRREGISASLTQRVGRSPR